MQERGRHRIAWKEFQALDELLHQIAGRQDGRLVRVQATVEAALKVTENAIRVRREIGIDPDVLAARGVTGVRLSCQILCDHEMTVRAISRFAGSGRKDAGKRPEDAIQPQPVEMVAK